MRERMDVGWEILSVLAPGPTLLKGFSALGFVPASTSAQKLFLRLAAAHLDDR